MIVSICNYEILVTHKLYLSPVVDNTVAMEGTVNI